MTEREQTVIAAVLRLRGNAYGVTVHEKFNELHYPRSLPLGAVYFTLDRLEDQGFLSSQLADPAPERGGRAKRYYRVEALAERAPASLNDVLESSGKEAVGWRPRRPAGSPVRPK